MSDFAAYVLIVLAGVCVSRHYLRRLRTRFEQLPDVVCPVCATYQTNLYGCDHCARTTQGEPNAR